MHIRTYDKEAVMADELITKPLRQIAVVAFHSAFTNNPHKGAARLWNGVDEWVAGQDTDRKRIYMAHVARMPDDLRFSSLINHSLLRHSFSTDTIDNVLDALLTAALMFLITDNPELRDRIPANLQIDPNNGYLIRKTPEHARVA